MRAITVGALILSVVACSQPVAVPSTAPLASPTDRATAQATCRLPIYWSVNNTAMPSGVEIHAAFLSVPNGAVSDAGVVAAQPSTYGATYLAASNSWVGVDRKILSPDGTRYAYWKGNPGTGEVHVVDIATGADRTVYSGPTLYIVLAFDSDGIYLVHAINVRQGAFEKLYRLDLAGGTPTLVTSSDRHMYQYGWVLISDGAAWGIDNQVQGEDYIYSLLRLDLATGQITHWLEGALGELVWPLGTDLKHRVYVQGLRFGSSVQTELWRISPGEQAVVLPDPGPIDLADYMPGPTALVADAHGVWMSGNGLWLYSDGAAPQHFAAGIASGAAPAGPCQ